MLAKSYVLCVQAKGPNLFLETWKWNLSKCHIMEAPDRTNCMNVFECKRARENKIHPFRCLAYFWLLFGWMCLLLYRMERACGLEVTVNGDGKKRCFLSLDCILLFHMGVEPKHMVFHLQDGAGWVSWMALNASRFSLIWSASKGKRKASDSNIV